jgi:ferric-dicitrate binding protein FerR (iron transport regulator)
MSDRPTSPDRDDQVARRLRELAEVDASPAFRERLRAEFVSGEIRTRTAPAPADLPGRTEPVRRRVGWRWWAIPAAAAAALVVVVLALANRAPRLEVLAVSGSGEIRVGDRTVAVANLPALQHAVRPGVEVEVPSGARLDLRIAGIAIYEITGGTRLTLPESPGRWFGRRIHGRIHAGELRLKTGPGFAGCRLRIRTPEGLVDVSGTLLSVQCDAGGTCVCVLEGTAHVGTDERDLEPVKPGFRKIMLRDGTVEIIPVKPMHRDGVLDFDRRIEDLIGAGSDASPTR